MKKSVYKYNFPIESVINRDFSRNKKKYHKDG